MDSRKTYNEHSSRYAQASEKSAPWIYFDVPALDADLQLTIDGSSRVLDLGCGSGKAIGYACRHGVLEEHIIGVDNSSELLALAVKHFPTARFICQNIAAFKSPGESFDLVLAIRVLEYLSRTDLDKVLASVFNSLKHNGVMFFIVGHPFRVNGPDISIYQQRGPREHVVPGGIPVTLYHKTVSDYTNAAVRAGFSISKLTETAASPALKQALPTEFARYTSYGAVTLVLRLLKP